MNEMELRKQITATGRELLADGLVARTWGNVSAKVDEEHFLITPSGLDYLQTKEEDLALYHPADKTWQGPHKPSSEKGIHAAAYELFPEAKFVIHTHQTFASAIGVCGFQNMSITADEKRQLGGIAIGEYGLPGTGKLKKGVTSAFKKGAHTVFMKHHGVVIAGESKEEAYERARLLEKICKKNICGYEDEVALSDMEKSQTLELLREIKKKLPGAEWVDTPAVVAWSRDNDLLVAQLDDMAQMIGRKIETVADVGEICGYLNKGNNALFIKGLGAVVCGRDEDDTEALKILVDKAAVCALNSKAAGIYRKLGLVDCKLMNYVYQKKYSKQKNG
ncbi:MAG: class II aldolase/adducin family protein [Pseudobutyrivibrio sp.]|nr:class II aldolase/adducin family protein [Pseudobutyrivibrio sp.]